MTERLRSTPGGLHFQISKLLVAAVIVATAATGALIVTVLIDMPSSAIPPPGPNGLPPPPPNLQPLAVFPIVTGFFVLSWLAVLVVFSRDQILQQLRQQAEPPPRPGISQDELGALLAGLRTELATDRERELQELSDRVAELTTEYGERRETDGYLSGMRTATATDRPEANVRALRRTPPQH
jgi:hypothetical protein